MANEKNLKRYGKEKPAPTSEEAKKAGSKGGKKSAEARAEAKTTREIAKMLDSLAVTGKNKEVLEQLGVPDDDQTQQTVRLVALHKKAMTGDVAAIKLWLEITGEAPTAKGQRRSERRHPRGIRESGGGYQGQERQRELNADDFRPSNMDGQDESRFLGRRARDTPRRKYGNEQDARRRLDIL